MRLATAAKLFVLVMAAGCEASAPALGAKLAARSSTARGIDSASPLADAAPTPTDPAAPPSPVVEIVATHAHACARRSNATVFCWGRNSDGQLGRETEHTSFDHAPADAVLDGIAQIAVGANRSCARMNDATVRCWGAPFFDAPAGAAGNGGATPRVIPRIDDATQVAVGDGHACVLHRGGTVSCWGAGGAGQLGDGTMIGRAATAKVVGLEGVVEIACSAGYSCARLGDGTLRCWGLNASAALGDGTRANQTRPVSVKNVRDAIQLGPAGQGWNCALLKDGHVACWGDELRARDGRSRHPVAVRIQGLEDVVEIRGSGENTCVRDTAGRVRCWGTFLDPEAEHAPGGPPLTASTIDTPTALRGVVLARGIATRGHAGVVVLGEDGVIRAAFMRAKRFSDPLDALP